MNSDQATATVIAAAIAVLGVLISAFISAFVSGRSRYINAVTSERSKWIEQLRNNLAEIISVSSSAQIAMARSAGYSQSQKWHEAIEKIELLLAVLKLQLNPKNKIDSNIIVLLDALAGALENGRFRTLEPLLVGHSQALLKEEWEKVKRESSGIVSCIFNIYGRWRRWSAYCTYSKGSGSVKEFQGQ